MLIHPNQFQWCVLLGWKHVQRCALCCGCVVVDWSRLRSVRELAQRADASTCSLDGDDGRRTVILYSASTKEFGRINLYFGVVWLVRTCNSGQQRTASLPTLRRTPRSPHILATSHTSNTSEDHLLFCTDGRRKQRWDQRVCKWNRG